MIPGKYEFWNRVRATINQIRSLIWLIALVIVFEEEGEIFIQAALYPRSPECKDYRNDV